MANNKTTSNMPAMNDDIGGYDAYALHKTDENGDDIVSLNIRVSGVHCAGCIQKIESRLMDNDAIDYARLNFSTGSLVMRWHGDVDMANDFVQQVSHLGYGVYPLDQIDDAQDKENKFLLMCMGVAGFAAGNIMLLSFGLWITNMETMGVATREFLHMISAVIAVPAIMFSGRPFFKSAFTALKNKHTNMDVPISLAIILATGMSLHQLTQQAEHVYFDSALMLTFFLLIGRYLDFRARANARSAATDLMSTLKGFVSIDQGDNNYKKIPIRDVKPGMVALVAMGEKIPVDGDIIKGDTMVDTSLVTGETVPVAVKTGDHVYAGTMNLSASIQVKIAKAADDSLLADIVRLMERAEQAQAGYTRIADRAAKLYTPMVHTLALAAFALWWGIMGMAWAPALMIAVTVLIITCPCALGLAVPVAQVLATGSLMKKGILVKSGDALERLAAIDMMCFDKTGTITKGEPTLVGDYQIDDLQLAASLAVHSSHPFSKAIVRAYDGNLLDITSVSEIAGQGVEGVIDGQKIQLGNVSWCGDDTAIEFDKALSSVALNRDGHMVEVFHFEDILRDGVQDTLQMISDGGVCLDLISGDKNAVVNAVAQGLPFDDALGGMKPTDKYNHIEQAKADGHTVAMVGDGLNDAPVLAGANVSIAPGTAIDMAQNAADIVFMKGDFHAVGDVYRMAKRTQTIIRENFAIAIVYNMIAVPVAFMGLVTPMIAAIAMSGSSLLVILNSFRLRMQK